MECNEGGMAEGNRTKYMGGQKDHRGIVRHGGGMMR